MNRKLLSSLRVVSLGALWLCWGQSAQAEWQKVGNTWYQEGQVIQTFPIFGREDRPAAMVQITIDAGEYPLRSPQFIPQEDAFQNLPREVRQFLSRLGFAFVEGDNLHVQRAIVVTEVVHQPDTIAEGATETTWHWRGLNAGVAAIRFCAMWTDRPPLKPYCVQFKNSVDLVKNTGVLRVASLPNQFFKRDLSWGPGHQDCWTVRIRDRVDGELLEFATLTVLADKLYVTMERVSSRNFIIHSGSDVDCLFYATDFVGKGFPVDESRPKWWRFSDAGSRRTLFACKDTLIWISGKMNDLQWSVVDGDLGKMRALLADGADATVKAEVFVLGRFRELSLLPLAALFGRTELLRDLIGRSPGGPLPEGDRDWYPLELIIVFGDVKIENGENEALSLLATPAVLDLYGVRALSECALANRPDIAKYILGRMSLNQVRARDEKGRTLLHRIIEGCSSRGDAGCAAVLKALFAEDSWNSLGAPKVQALRGLLEDQDSAGCTPLYRAELAQMPLTRDGLMELGDSWSKATGDGRTLLHVTTEKGNLELLRKLSRIRAFQDNPNVQDRSGRTALHCATTSGGDKIVEEFLKLFPGADINIRDGEGRTPLYCAAKWECYKMLDALLKKKWKGIDPRRVQRRIKVFSYIFDGDPLENGAALLAEESGVKPASSETDLLFCKGAVHFLVHCGDAGLEVFDLWADRLLSTLPAEPEGLSILFDRDKNGKTAWDLAIELGHREFSRALNDLLINPRMEDLSMRNRTMLHWVSEFGVYNAVLPLLVCMTPEQVAQRDKGGKTARDLAVDNGHNNIVQVIDGFVPDRYGVLLRQEASLGNLNVVLLLLARMTPDQVARQNKDVKTARNLAAASGHKDVVKALDDFTKYGSALVTAVRAKQVPVVSRLLMLPWVNVNAKDKTDVTALYHAVLTNNVPCVRALLRRSGIEVNAQAGASKNTALFAACMRGYVSIAELLLKDARVDVNAPSQNSQRTALHQAAASSVIDCVRLLLAHDQIDVNRADSQRTTALFRAVEKGDAAIVRLLLQKKKPGGEAAVDMTDVRRIHGAFSGSADPKVRSAVRLVKGFIDSEGRSLPGAEEDDATDASTSASSVF